MDGQHSTVQFYNGNFEIAKTLLSFGADPDIATKVMIIFCCVSVSKTYFIFRMEIPLC